MISEETLAGELRSDVRELLEVRGATIYGHLGSESLTDDERCENQEHPESLESHGMIWIRYFLSPRLLSSLALSLLLAKQPGRRQMRRTRTASTKKQK